MRKVMFAMLFAGTLMVLGCVKEASPVSDVQVEKLAEKHSVTLVENAEPNLCDPGFSLDEFGNCSPDCTNTEEVCNGVDDDCDRKIDEDDVCVIDPLTNTKSIARPTVHTVIIEEDSGALREVSYNDMAVLVNVTEEVQLRELLDYLDSLGAKVIGQIDDTWQVAVDEPERLVEIRDQIGQHPYVELVLLYDIWDVSVSN